MARLRSAATSDVNLRKHASAEAPILKQLESASEFELHGNDGEWLWVNFAGQMGFVNGRFARQLSSESNEPQWQTTVTAPGLNLRSDTTTDLPDNIVGQLTRGQKVGVIGHRLGSTNSKHVWLRVLHEGRPAFARADFTSSIEEDGASLGEQVELKSDRPRLEEQEIKRERQRIAQMDDVRARGDAFEALQAKVMYANQRDNQATLNGVRVETRKGQMCNLTSLAMALSYLGIPNPEPGKQYEDALERIRQQRVRKPRTDSRGWGGTALECGANFAFISEGEKALSRTWWEQNARPVLRRGEGVIMSICEHIVRLQAITPEGLIVDDPYGRCRLKPGGAFQWEYIKPNGWGDPPQPSFGNDSLWKWADVEQHKMRWVARIFLSDRRDPPPDVHFEDSGIVVEEEEEAG